MYEYFQKNKDFGEYLGQTYATNQRYSDPVQGVILSEEQKDLLKGLPSKQDCFNSKKQYYF